MTTLVTGAAGFIGTALINELICRGDKIYALIEENDLVGKKQLLEISPNIEIVYGLPQLMYHESEYPRFNTIFHLATVGVRPEFNNIDLICDVNIKMGCQIVDFAERNETELVVNFGSCCEYGDHGNVLLSEEMECRPESLYAISKNASTNLTTAYAKTRGVNLITVRPFGVFGKGEGLSRLAPSIIESCLRGQIIKTTQGEQVRDFVNVKDLVKAIIILSGSTYSAYEIYNICSSSPVSVKQFIEEVITVCGFDLSLIKFGSIPYRKNEAMMFAGKNSKLQNLIHYPFPDNHRDGILDIYNDLKSEV